MALKKISLMTVILLAGCGKIPTSEFKLGQAVNFKASALSQYEKKNLTDLCESLRIKFNKFSQTSGLKLNFEFDVGRKSCEAESLGPLASVTVTLEESAGGYRFKEQNGLNFIYSDPETHQTGVMGLICGESSTNDSNLRQQSEDIVSTFTLSPPREECAPTAGEVCIRIDTAMKASDGSHRLGRQDWIKFNIDERHGRYGFFTERRTRSTALCGAEQHSETVAILKN